MIWLTTTQQQRNNIAVRARRQIDPRITPWITMPIIQHQADDGAGFRHTMAGTSMLETIVEEDPENDERIDRILETNQTNWQSALTNWIDTFSLRDHREVGEGPYENAYSTDDEYENSETSSSTLPDIEIEPFEFENDFQKNSYHEQRVRASQYGEWERQYEKEHPSPPYFKTAHQQFCDNIRFIMWIWTILWTVLKRRAQPPSGKMMRKIKEMREIMLRFAEEYTEMVAEQEASTPVGVYWF